MLASRKFLFIGALVVAALTLAFAGPASAATQWEPLGPYGGDRFELKISPYDNQTLFVYGVQGIHKSVDGGATWYSVSTPDMEKMNGILSLDFDPLNPLTMYLGGTTRGIWKSVDGGETWADVSNGIPMLSAQIGLRIPIYSLVVSPTGVIYAGSGDPSTFGVPGAAWIYESVDAGGTWQAMDSGVGILSGEPLTQSKNVLLSKDLEGQIWAMVYGGGVFRLEHGAWVSHRGDLPERALRATHLAHHPTEAGSLYLGTEDGWVYSSSDYGRTWTAVALPDELAPLPVLPMVYFVGVDPNNADMIIVRANDNYGSSEQPLFRPRGDQTAGGGLYYTFDRGGQWLYYPVFLFRLTLDPAEVFSGTIPGVGVVARSKVSYLTTGGYSSVNKSVDGQSNYSSAVEGIDNVLINTVWAHPNPPAPYASVVIGGAESGLYLTEAGASPAWKRQQSTNASVYTWSLAPNYQDQNEVFYGVGNPSFDFQAERGVYVTDLSCLQSVESSCPPGTQLLSDVGVWRVVTTPADPLKIYAACQEDGVMYSDDGGQNWQTLNDGLTLPASVTDLILAPDGSPMLASTRTSNGSDTEFGPNQWLPARSESGSLYSFDAQQQQWTKLDSIDAAIIGMDMDVTNTILYAATVMGIYRSDDNGATCQNYVWEDIFTDVLVDQSAPEIVYAGSFNGVYRALDGGLGWAQMNAGLESHEANQLSIDTGTGDVYLATSGGSIFRRPPDASPESVISLDIPDLDFGTVPVGFMSEASVTITNYGEANLDVQSIVPDHGDITIVESFPQTLAPWTTSVVTVRFSPTAIQTVNAFAVITSNDPAAPTISFPVNGEGVAPNPVIPDVKINGSDGPLTLPRSASVNVSIGITAGDYAGQPAELWIGCNNPVTGMQWFVEGSGWAPSPTPIVYSASSIIADVQIPIDMGSGLTIGDYDFEFTVDNVVNGSLDAVWRDTLTMTIEPQADPALDVKLNGSDGPLTLGFGTPVTVTVDLVAGDYVGTPTELWISADTPIGMQWYAEGSGWAVSATPIAFRIDSAMGDFQIPIDMGSTLPAGDYDYVFTVDNVINGTLDAVWQDSLSSTIVPVVAPTPDVKINGADGPVSVTVGTNVTVSINLTAGDYAGQSAEFWIGLQTPFGPYWFVEGSGWTQSATPIVYKNGSVIANLSLPINMGSGLPAGAYDFELTVDNVINGSLDQVWSDSAGLTITASDPIPDVKINGYDVPPSHSSGIPTNLTLSLSSGSYGGEPAELWIGAQTPVGTYWYVAGSGWVSSSAPVRFAAMGIMGFSQPINLGSRLPAGSYRFEFTVDNIINGTLDSVWADTVSMSVN